MTGFAKCSNESACPLIGSCDGSFDCSEDYATVDFGENWKLARLSVSTSSWVIILNCSHGDCLCFGEVIIGVAASVVGAIGMLYIVVSFLLTYMQFCFLLG